MENVQVAILLDRKSRSKIKSPLTELSNAGIIFLKEIEDAVFLNKSKEFTVILLGNVLDNVGIISKLKVYKALLDLNYLYMGQSNEAVDLLKDFVRIYPCDFTSIDMRMITAALLKDQAFQKELRDEVVMNTKVAKLLSDGELPEEMKDVLKEYQVLYEKYKEMQRSQAQKERELKKLNRRLDVITEIKERFSKGYQKIIKNAYDLNVTLKEYEGVLTTDVYTKVDVYRYSNRPFILYFKVFESLLNQELFFSILYEVIQKQLHKSVKIVNLYDSKTCRQIKTLSNNYHCIYNKFNMNDTLPGLIAKSGDYTELLDILLSNKTGLDYLVIVDYKSIDDTVMLGQDLSFNICVNKNHLHSYRLSPRNTVVFDNKNEFDLTFNNVEDDIKDLSKEEAFLKLSSLNVFQQIINSIKMQRSV